MQALDLFTPHLLKAVVGGPAMAGPLFLPRMQTLTCDASNLFRNCDFRQDASLLVIPVTNATSKKFSAPRRVTRSSATAERQRVSYTRLSRLTH